MAEKRDASESDAPVVSVVVPAYNAEDTIGECIESLLAQDYARCRLEIVMVDNDSSDATAEIIKGYPVTYVLENKAHTSYAARNAGVHAARGELLAFCDADEKADEHWLSALVETLRKLGDSYGGVLGKVEYFAIEENAATRFGLQEQARWRYADDTDVEEAATANVLYRREVFEKLGGFDPAAQSGGDFHFSRRVVRELGLRIRHTFSAVTHHPFHATLGVLMRHEARVACGHEWYAREHDLPRRSLAGLLFGAATRTVRSLGAAALAAAQGLFSAPKREKAKFIAIGWLLHLANTYGRIRFRRGKPVPRHW